MSESGKQGASKAAAFSENMLPPGARIGEFEILSLIGEGGFGIVYLVRDHALEREVALKEYMPSSLATRGGDGSVHVRSQRDASTFDAGLRSFVNEAKLLAQFDHPALVKVHRFWEGNGTAYMVMPFYEGVTLKDTLKRLGRTPSEAWLKSLLGPLLDALATMHRRQCYHRDIAPDNILILDEGGPLLLDFGAARRVISDMTQVLTVILKPGYAPVEQYGDMGTMKQGAWTDIYALSSVIHYAIAGQPPPPAVGRLVADSLVPLAESAAGHFSAQFLTGVDHGLAVKPADRPQDVAAFRAALGLAPVEAARRTVAPVKQAAVESFAETIPRAIPAEVLRAAVAAVAQSPPQPQPPVEPLQLPGMSVPAMPAMPQAPDFDPAAPLPPAARPAKDGSRAASWPRWLSIAGVIVLLVLAAIVYILLRKPESATIPAPASTSATVQPVAHDAAPQPSPLPSAAQPASTPPTAVPDAASTAPAAQSAPVQPSSTATPTKAESEASHRSSGSNPAHTQRAVPAPSRPSPAPANTAPASPKLRVDSARCADLLQRASLGEPLSDADRTALRNCR